ncbi:MAG: hypothetical protein ACRD4M_02795 [Candidatus Acidiferrales bacterium]
MLLPNEFPLILVIEVFGVIGMLYLFWKKCNVPNLQINVDSDIFPSTDIPPSDYGTKWRFHLVGPGVAQMIYGNRNGAIEDAFRTRKIPVSLNLRGSRLTFVIDARNYDKSGEGLGGGHSIFKADRSADLRSSFSEIEGLFSPHGFDLNPTNPVGTINSDKSDYDPQDGANGSKHDSLYH